MIICIYVHYCKLAGGKVEQSLPIHYSLQSNSSGVCVTCAFLDSSTTDCVAVVHQRISQLNTSGLMNIESSHKFTRSGDTASGCIERVNLEDYQVGVIGGKQVQKIPQKGSQDYSTCIIYINGIMARSICIHL